MLKATTRPDVAVALAVVVPPTTKVAGAKLTAPIVWETRPPVPLSVMLSGLLAASLVMTMLPLRAPAAVGVKVTLMVQLAAAARVAPQVVVLAKSPLMPMLAMFSVAPPLLVRVTVCAALVLPTFCEVKVSVVGLGDTPGAKPVPLRAADCTTTPLLTTVTSPVRAPLAVGVKLTLTVQVAPAAKVHPQVVVRA